MTWVAVLLGGAGGAALRVEVAVRLGRGAATPWSVAAVNLLGALLAGTVAGAGAAGRWPTWLAVGVSTGLLGAFTTFSTWGVDVVALWTAGQRWRSVALAGGSMLLGVGLAGAGLWVGHRL